MKRKEIKKAFEDVVGNIEVSNELKEKTLNNIYSKNNVYHFPYWIKNCVAVFVVTCLCLSIYLINNKNLFYFKGINEETLYNKPVSENIDNIPILNSTFTGENRTLQKSASLNDYATDNMLKSELFLSSQSLEVEDSYQLESSIEEYIGLSEEEFLINNPYAKKTTDGYILIKNDKETLYKLDNGIISEKIILK